MSFNIHFLLLRFDDYFSNVNILVLNLLSTKTDYAVTYIKYI